MAEVTNMKMYTSLFITIMAIAGMQFGPEMLSADEPNYFCEGRLELGVVQCDSFSKYVDPNGKCIRNGDTNLICKSGWILITPDLVIPDETPKIEEDQIILGVAIRNYEENGKDIQDFVCTSNGIIGYTINDCVSAINLVKQDLIFGSGEVVVSK